MKNELSTSGERPVHVRYTPSEVLILDDGIDVVEFFKGEIKELRDFLNQLDLK